MSALIRNAAGAEGSASEAPGPKGLFIRGRCYANTAAKFWAGLVDEILAEHPTCRLAELSCASSARLDRDLLHPERALQKDLESLWEADFEQVLKETIAELDLLGAPPPVRLRLLHGAEVLFDGDLPKDCLDAEIFDHLLAWPLEWARIPEERWNDPRLSGEFTAEDYTRGLRYVFAFTVLRQELSEGLFRRVVSLLPAATSL